MAPWKIVFLYEPTWFSGSMGSSSRVYMADIHCNKTWLMDTPNHSFLGPFNRHPDRRGVVLTYIEIRLKSILSLERHMVTWKSTCLSWTSWSSELGAMASTSELGAVPGSVVKLQAPNQPKSIPTNASTSDRRLPSFWAEHRKTPMAEPSRTP